MWYAVYRAQDGGLVSQGTVVADPLPEGLVAVALGEERPAGVWNPATRSFDPAPTAPREPLPVIDFMRRFGFVKEAQIRAAAKTDPMIETFLSRLNIVSTVNLDHPETTQGVGYLQQAGLLTAAEAAAVLA